MTAFAILMFALGAWSSYCAFRPQTAWRLTEGWKYRDPENVQPSDAYLGVQSIGAGIGALAAFGIGIALLVIPSGEERQRDREREAEEERSDCESVSDRFGAAVRFTEGHVANASEVESLATELGVQIEIRETAIAPDLTYDSISVRRDGDFLFLMSDTTGARCA